MLMKNSVLLKKSAQYLYAKALFTECFCFYYSQAIYNNILRLFLIISSKKGQWIRWIKHPVNYPLSSANYQHNRTPRTLSLSWYIVCAVIYTLRV